MSASLEDLHEDLAARTGRTPDGSCRALAAELPLLHRTMAPDRLLSEPHLTPSPGSNNRRRLGLDEYVFLWVGACPYDDCRLILIWAASAERSPPDGFGAPWDSGGLLTSGVLGTNPDLERAQEALERYSLPLGTYRSYLSMVLECSFEQPDDYLHARPPSKWYPGCVGNPSTPLSPPCRTFEVRREGSVPVSCELVAIVVDQPAFADDARLLRRLRERFHDVEWIPTRSRERAPKAARRFVEQFLQDRGVK